LTITPDLERRPALVWLVVATGLGAAYRFYNLDWGAPYFHFHIDEHVVFTDAYLLARDSHAAAMSAKFFMYSPLPPYILNGLVWLYESLAHPLNLTSMRDQITYMVLGRAISATLGTATIPLVYIVASRVGGRLAGVLAAFLLAGSVIHLRDSHFFALDVSMAFFTVLAWCFLARTVERGDAVGTVGSGLGLGLGLLSKYSATFIAPLIGLAEVLSPAGPKSIRPFRPWIRSGVRTAAAGAVGLVLFLALFPLVIKYYGKFRSDIKDWVIDPLSGTSKPEWIAQFADVNAIPYWFTNLLWWGLGPALEIWALAGVIWLFIRRDRLALLTAAFPIAYGLSAGRTASIAPFIRYVVPLAPPLAVTAAVLSADLIRRPRVKWPGLVATTIVVAQTLVWATAYMNVYRAPDSRLEASRWLLKNVPPNSKILIEPSQNTPPIGSYLTAVSFHESYVMFYPQTEKHDYYWLYPLDTYRSLYNRGVDDEWRRNYIKSRLALADWIVMDDSFLQQYEHLPASEHGVVKQYYRDLFAGRLGFQLVQTFKVYPSILGVTINDDGAEMTFRSFDHPRVFIFRRQ
jgi:4-amino-4-deoxy-L-arabinose transferase-like glycosyltransferase